MKGWTYEIVNEYNQVNWYGSFKFFSTRNEWKEIRMCNTWKKQGQFFYIMEAKILDINQQSSNANCNVIFLQNYK